MRIKPFFPNPPLQIFILGLLSELIWNNYKVTLKYGLFRLLSYIVCIVKGLKECSCSSSSYSAQKSIYKCSVVLEMENTCRAPNVKKCQKVPRAVEILWPSKVGKPVWKNINQFEKYQLVCKIWTSSKKFEMEVNLNQHIYCLVYIILMKPGLNVTKHPSWWNN